VVAAAVGALVVGLTAGPPAPAAAVGVAGPREVTVIPADLPVRSPHDVIIFGCATGFLHRISPSTDYLWTRYDTGASLW
jgi:hypothetical protein